MTFAKAIGDAYEEGVRDGKKQSDAEAIVKALAESDPAAGCTTYDDGSIWCQFCDAEGPDDEPLTHEPTCVWRRAVEHTRRVEQ